MITAVSHLMGTSSIRALQTLEEGCVIYTGLIATASTGKSSAMNLVKNAIYEIENYLMVDDENSKFVNGIFMQILKII